jgi:glycerol-3-phosphate acyltransferase PlsX
MQTKATYELLQVGHDTGRYNFVGNIEASHIFTSQIADVVICDGFVGNIVVKLAEGLYSINAKTSSTNQFWEGLNYENIGGTPVLGINAPVVVGHGKSTPLAIKNMILSTEHTIQSRLVEKLKSTFK